MGFLAVKGGVEFDAVAASFMCPSCKLIQELGANPATPPGGGHDKFIHEPTKDSLHKLLLIVREPKPATCWSHMAHR